MNEMQPINQDRAPNFRADGQLFLVRCFACEPTRGRENYAPAVATGRCAFCGWTEFTVTPSKPSVPKVSPEPANGPQTLTVE